MSESTATDPYVLGAWIRMCQLAGDGRSVETQFEKVRIDELTFLS